MICASNISGIGGAMNRLAKQVAMLTLLLMPMGVDATVEVPHRNDAPTYLFWLAMIMVSVTFFIRALGWIRGYGVDFNHIADASFEELLGVLITGAVIWAESCSLESCVIAIAIVALLMQQRELSTARTVIAKLVSERNERVLQARRERDRDDRDLYRFVRVTGTGECYHTSDCGHVRGNNDVRTLRRCNDCFRG